MSRRKVSPRKQPITSKRQPNHRTPSPSKRAVGQNQSTILQREAIEAQQSSRVEREALTTQDTIDGMRADSIEQPQENLRVYMSPSPKEAENNLKNAINHIVVKLAKHLPQFGIELVEEESSADLRAVHAGQGVRGFAEVAHCHGLYPTAYPEWTQGNVYYSINRRVMDNILAAKEVTVPSDWVADLLRRDMHLSPHVIGWAIDVDDWPMQEQHRGYVLWNKTRAVDVCDPKPVNALAAFAPDMPFVTTFGESKENVIVIGVQEWETMRKIVQEACVYLATTKETFGVGTLEAMASGLPVLGYSWGGTANLVEHGVTGYLVEPGNIDGLKQGLDYCLEHRAILGRNARQVALKYTWDKVASEFARIYRLAVQPNISPVKVSVVIPVHNYAHYLPDSIGSSTGQQADFPYEIIVVDDCSTDNSAEVAENLLLSFPNSRVIRLESNAGVATARNVGIHHAQGELIVCLDADDRMGSPTFLQILASAFDDPLLGIAYTGIYAIDHEGKLRRRAEWPTEFDFEAQTQRRNQVPTCCMFRKRAWERAGGYRKRFEPAEDAELWLRITSQGWHAKRVTDEPIFHYRIHDQSLSHPFRIGHKREPNWLELHPWVHDNKRPFAVPVKMPDGKDSWPVHNYDQPLVSIIIPVGPGHTSVVSQALDSVEGQTERFWECIVINDSGQFLNLAAYPWAKVIETERPGMGAGHARNLGIDAATAPMVTFLDADDWFMPTFLADTLKAHVASGGKYVYTDWMNHAKDGKAQVHETPEYSTTAVFRRQSIHSVSVLVAKSDLVNRNIRFDEEMGAWEDVDFFMALAANGVCGVRVPKPLLTYRYLTGARREYGEEQKEALIALLRNRYAEYVMGEKMCDCEVTQPAIDGYLASIQVNDQKPVEDAKEDMVHITYRGQHGARKTVTGSVTKTFYGRREPGETFWVYRSDQQAEPGLYEPFVDMLSAPMKRPSGHIHPLLPPQPLGAQGG